MELAAAEPAAGAVAEVPAAQEDLLADIEGLDDVDWDACGDALSWAFLNTASTLDGTISWRLDLSAFLHFLCAHYTPYTQR